MNSISALANGSRPTLAAQPDSQTLRPMREALSPRGPGEGVAIDPARLRQAVDPAGDATKTGSDRRGDDTEATLRATLKQIAGSFEPGSKLVIRRDSDANRFVYEFRDGKTGDLVRQFPEEDVLKALAAYRDRATGGLLNNKI
jgi:uncharacterized FlaG/YvyC family protein